MNDQDRARSGRQRVRPRRRYDPMNPASLWEPNWIDQTDLATRPEYRVLSEPHLVAEIANWNPASRDALMALSPAYRNYPQLTAPRVTLTIESYPHESSELNLRFDEQMRRVSIVSEYDALPVPETHTEYFNDVVGLQIWRRLGACWTYALVGPDAVERVTDWFVPIHFAVWMTRASIKRTLDAFARQWSAYLVTTPRWAEITDEIERFIYTPRPDDTIDWRGQALPAPAAAAPPVS